MLGVCYVVILVEGTMQGIMIKIVRGIMKIGISALALPVQLPLCMIGICADRKLVLIVV